MDSLGDRMKGYECASRTILTRRMPVIVRVDGKAFHTYTAGAEKPFDRKLIAVMEMTAMELCREIQGAQIAYTQSDEISILVHNYKSLNSEAWFDNQVQKMCSVAAATASSTFTAESWRIWMGRVAAPVGLESIRPAKFDARVFVLPEAEVCNYFIWRQQDAIRNSVQMLARSLFSHKVCENKNCDELKEMCREKGSDWNMLPSTQRRGRCLARHVETLADGTFGRSCWKVDHNIPIFSESRDYVNKHLAVNES